MSSHDDPEERIRELERSLNDRTAELTQSSAEMGPGQYAPPPHPPYPPPHPPYGAPFPAGQTSSGGGISKGWLIAGLLTVMVTVGLVAGAVSFFRTVFSSVTSVVDLPSNTRTVSGGGGPFGDVPGGSGGNRPQITIAEPTVSSAPPGGDVSVSGVGENKTIACNDALVSISGVSNTVVLTGHCTSVTISGIENVVTIDDADTISASGFDNRVTYRTGSPDIQNSGGANVVEQG